MRTMTVNRLYKALGQLIEDGHGRLPVCVNKDTFQHNLEGDGCVILPVNHVLAQYVVQIDDDGGTKVDAKGRECYQHNVVLFGDAADAEGKYEPPTRDSPPTPACDKLRGAAQKVIDRVTQASEGLPGNRSAFDGAYSVTIETTILRELRAALADAEREGAADGHEGFGKRGRE